MSERLQVCVNKAVQITVHNSVDIAGFKAGTMVLDHGIGHEDIGADLGTPADGLLVAPDVLDLVQMLPLLDLQQLGFQHPHSHVLVLVLASLYLAGNHNAGRQVGNPNRRRGLVNLLSAGAAGPVKVYLKIFRTDFDGSVQLLHNRHNLQRSKGGLTASRGVKGGHPDQPVDTGLRFQEAVGIVAFHLNRGALDAGLVAVQVVQQGHLVAVCLCPVVVHPELPYRQHQHGR